MPNLHVYWLVAAGVLVLISVIVGRDGDSWFLGVLRDERGRLSLSQTQMYLWTVVILSLLAAVAFARLFAGVDDPLNIQIPTDLLTVMGISLGSGALASGIKAAKDRRAQADPQALRIRTAPKPHLAQLVRIEEGSGDEVVDLTRFQNLSITILLLAVYVTSAWHFLGDITDLADPLSLPAFGEGMAALLAISHGGYLAAKIPDRA
ncbi:MAG: hypothetical protein D6701_13560 [Gemmatimonadetes bacterium]|nr:MAG: hypothetical protein D6701_13560 [Gemmatimonadota bacterium]